MYVLSISSVCLLTWRSSAVLRGNRVSVEVSRGEVAFVAISNEVYSTGTSEQIKPVLHPK